MRNDPDAVGGRAVHAPQLFDQPRSPRAGRMVASVFIDESVLGVPIRPPEVVLSVVAPLVLGDVPVLGDALVLGAVVSVLGDGAVGVPVLCGVVVVDGAVGAVDESVLCAYTMPAMTAKAAVPPMRKDRNLLMTRLLSK